MKRFLKYDTEITKKENSPVDKNGLIKEDIGGGGGVQPDWNQNDSTAADYVKNRPFYAGNPVETVLVEESTVSFADDGGIYSAEFESTFEATVGETYKVYWDGTAYECTCVESESVYWIGNLSIVGMDSDTGEPFILKTYNDGYITIATADTSASHTFSISGIVEPIVKIPAKFIDKDASGYIVVHRKSTMTEEEAQNYEGAFLRNEVAFIICDEMCLKYIGLTGVYNDLSIITQNGEEYLIAKNAEGLFNLNDRTLYRAVFPLNNVNLDVSPEINIFEGKIRISPSSIHPGVGTTDVLFYVQPNGTKSKSFEVLGNGEAVAPALILYSSTADSTKKFRITVDDSGTLTATEVS